jgi:hypothetical protein
MSQIHAASADSQPSGDSLQKKHRCAIAALLDRHGALYSYNDPLYRLALLIGMLRPLCCSGCGAWFLVEVEPDRRPS